MVVFIYIQHMSVSVTGGVGRGGVGVGGGLSAGVCIGEFKLDMCFF